MKIPELPASRRCLHSQTNSKFLNDFFDRVTPRGVPEHDTELPFQFHVSGLQFTLMKSSEPNGVNPGPEPSIWAMGRGADGGSSSLWAAIARTARGK